MGTATIVWRAGDYPPLQFQDDSDWDERWLGQRVTFTIAGHRLYGEVIETQRVRLCNGTHDILTVEVESERKQVKIKMHRQACRRVAG